MFEESRELYRQVGDEAGIARAEWMVVIRDLAAGNWDPPIATAEEAVANWRRTGDRLSLADGLVWTAVVYARASRLTEARSAVLEALQLFRAADSPIGIVSVILSLAAPGEVGSALRRRAAAGGHRGIPPRTGRRPRPLEFLAGFLGDPEAEARAHLSPEAPSGPSSRAGQ